MKKYVVYFGILWACAFAVDSSPASAKDEVFSTFVKAGLAYNDSRFEEAVNDYTAILKAGLESGPLYYNLGNSYFRLGKVGLAVLNFERAKRLIPRDSDLRFNSQYANSRVKRFETDQALPWYRAAFQDFLSFFTFDEFLVLITVSFMLAGVIFIVALYLRPPIILTRWALAASLIAAGLFSMSLLVKYNTEQGQAIAVVSSDTFFEPKEGATVHFKLNEGMKVRILKTEGRWSKVERSDGKVGWAEIFALELI